MSPVIELADQVVAALNREAWPITFTAVRRYKPVKAKKDLEALCVSVVPVRRKSEVGNRHESDNELRVDIGFQVSLKSDDNETLDALVNLVDSVHEWAMKRVISDQVWEAIWESADLFLFNPDALDRSNVFESVIQLTFSRDMETER